jgi:glycosyltransferase involved in cell wall biosynthesis
MSKLVSIALCTYNGERFLDEQLKSILQQSYRELEVVIIDDCSTDASVEIIKSYAETDERIIYSINESNLGFNKNFEKAISFCKGEYIAIADQDDIWELNKIELMLQEWPAHSDFVFSLSGNFTDSNFENRTPAPSVYYDNIDDTRKLVFNSPVHGHACMFKRDFFKLCTPFPENIFYDWWMSMHAASRGIVGCIPLTLTWHRVHSNNSSRKLISIDQKQVRMQKLREQCAMFIEKFFSVEQGKPNEREMLLNYAAFLKLCNGKKFQWPLFLFIMKHRKVIFHYKKKPFVIVSHLKYALKMARNGLL